MLRQAVEAGEVPGVVAVAADDSGVIYQGAFGRRSLASDAPMTPDTVFRIASMTKAITGTAAMQMVEQGKLALDQPAGEVVPELAAPMVLEGFDDAGKPMLRPAREKVTLRRLLTHTAGFVYDTWNANQARYARVTGPAGGAHRQAGGVERAAGIRTGRALGIRHQHRLGRPHGGGGQRAEPGSLYAGSTSSSRWACATAASIRGRIGRRAR